MGKLGIILFLTIISCNVKSDQVKFSNGDIEVIKYTHSEITSGHDLIDIRRGKNRINIFEANTFGFTDVLIKNDTILIQYLPTTPYKFIDTALGYKIVFDTLVSIEYYQQKIREREH